MRKLASGEVLASKLALPEAHPAFEAFRQRLATRVAEEAQAGGFYRGRAWHYAQLDRKMPSRDPEAAFAPAPGTSCSSPKC